MTRGKQGRGDLSPSLFPFLAVLLCTVGALVLILVLVVGQSQAAVKQAVETKSQRSEELKAQVEAIRDSFKETREKIQLEIEKKRMSLQALEQQTVDLTKELEQLQKTSELMDQQRTETQESEEKIASRLTELQKQLEETAEKLKNKLAQPKGDKPVFAIIPYEGSHGTHRRPIYLECRPEGIVIQPEGIVITLKDLRPPYGPGNPLDAALRTVRTYYAPKDGALNSSAYPLLVVRSSGIRTYALARLAMAGWDDQFGYELIEDDMELSFPEGEASLGKELERTLVAARNRQATLVMAMPGRYRKAIEELSEDKISFEDGEGGWGGADANGGGTGDASDGIGAGGVAGNKLGASTNGLGPNGQPLDISGSSLADGQRGGFAFAPDGSQAGPPGAGGLMSGPPGGNGATGMYGFATGGQSQTGANNPAGNRTSDGAAGTTWNSPNGAGQSAEATSFAQGAFSGNQYTRGGSGQTTAGEGGGQQASDVGNSNSTSKSAGTNGRAGTFRDAMTAARSKQSGTTDMQGTSASGSSAETGSGGSQYASPRSEGFGSVSGSAAEINAQAMSPSADLSMNKKKNKEKVEAVAKRKGRNWAWSAGPARETAVVRNIRIACYEDRWIVMPDQGSKDKPYTVMLDVAPQTSAEELAKVIADKVDRWGYALAGGYWKPVLEVEVAPRGEQRYDELCRLLDGSGLDVRPLNAPVGSQPR